MKFDIYATKNTHTHTTVLMQSIGHKLKIKIGHKPIRGAWFFVKGAIHILRPHILWGRGQKLRIHNFKKVVKWGGKGKKKLVTSFVDSFLGTIYIYRKSTKICWHNVWMVPKGNQGRVLQKTHSNTHKTWYKSELEIRAHISRRMLDHVHIKNEF